MYIESCVSYRAMSRYVKNPRADFVSYCTDLAHHTCSDLDSLALYSSVGCSFSDLFDQFVYVNPEVLQTLKGADYCFIVHETPEFDPGYSHVGVYIKNKYKVSSEIFDFISCETMALFSAMKIARLFIGNGALKNAAFLFFEQESVPVVCDIEKKPSHVNACGLLKLVNAQSFARVVLSKIVTLSLLELVRFVSCHCVDLAEWIVFSDRDEIFFSDLLKTNIDFILMPNIFSSFLSIMSAYAGKSFIDRVICIFDYSDHGGWGVLICE